MLVAQYDVNITCPYCRNINVVSIPYNRNYVEVICARCGNWLKVYSDGGIETDSKTLTESNW